MRIDAQRSDRIPELEGLRAVLAWTVVAAHVLICSGYFGPVIGNQNVLNDVAEAAVDVFIILSGFVITRLVLVEREAYHRFLWRRIRRIFPAYWVALLAGIATNGLLANNLRHFLPHPAAASFIRMCDIGAARWSVDIPIHALLLQGLAPAALLPAEPYTFLGVAWSLSLEWQFYVLAPLAVWFSFKRPTNAAALAAVCLGCAFLSSGIVSGFSNAFLPAKAALFFVGGYSFAILHNRAASTALWKIVALAVIAAGGYLGSSHRVVEAVLPAAIWLCVMTCVARGVPAPVRDLLNSALFQHLGKISYSTYLFHAPVVAVIQSVIWQHMAPADRLSLLLLTAPFAIPATYVVSSICWRCIENPLQLGPPGRA